MSKMSSPGWGESPPGDPKNAHRRGGLYTHYTNPLGLTFAMGFPPRPPIKKNDASRFTRPPSAWMPLTPLDHHHHGCLSLHSTTIGMDASRSTRPPSAWMPLASLDHSRHGCLSHHSTTKKDSRAKALLSHRRKTIFHL